MPVLWCVRGGGGDGDGRLTGCEDVLVILGEDAAGDDVAVIGGLAWVDVDNGHDARGADLQGDAAGGVEFVGEDVFVVCECDDELDDEFAHAGDDCTACSPVGVLFRRQ